MNDHPDIDPLARYANGARRSHTSRSWRLLGVCLVSLLVACAANPADESDDVAVVETAPAKTVIDQEVPLVEQYLRGLAEYDAERMWLAFNDGARRTIESRGGSKADLQRRLEESRSRGQFFEKFHRQGVYLLPDGGAYVFYVAVRRERAPSASASEIYYIFTIDAEGRVAEIK